MISKLSLLLTTDFYFLLAGLWIGCGFELGAGLLRVSFSCRAQAEEAPTVWDIWFSWKIAEMQKPKAVHVGRENPC